MSRQSLSIVFTLVSLTGSMHTMRLDRMSMLTVMVVSIQFLKIHMLLQLFFFCFPVLYGIMLSYVFVITLLFV